MIRYDQWATDRSFSGNPRPSRSFPEGSNSFVNRMDCRCVVKNYMDIYMI